MIKSINTFYDGNYFRSRLEARWAVYFNHIGVKYEYEPEGYVLDTGDCYLTDFYFPDYNIYGEVKPYAVNDKRWFDFVRGIKKDLVVFTGQPIARDMTVIHSADKDVCLHCNSTMELWFGFGENDKHDKPQCPKCGTHDSYSVTEVYEVEGTPFVDIVTGKYHPIHFFSGDPDMWMEYDLFKNAVSAAIRSRFEHRR